MQTYDNKNVVNLVRNHKSKKKINKNNHKKA